VADIIALFGSKLSFFQIAVSINPQKRLISLEMILIDAKGRGQ
jgi:hypothetical protein